MYRKLIILLISFSIIACSKHKKILKPVNMSNRRTPMFWYDNVDGELRANGYACKRSIRSAKTFAKNESMINLANMIKQEAMSFINENFSDTDAQALSTMFNQNETIKLSGYKEAGCEVREEKER